MADPARELDDLVTANRIPAHRNIVASFGHVAFGQVSSSQVSSSQVSIRHPGDQAQAVLSPGPAHEAACRR